MVFLPVSVSKAYSFSTGTQGSSWRRRASSSACRMCSFSASSSSRRAASHSSWSPVPCSAMGNIVSTMANDTFKALAHPLRRDIVERLSGGVATVGEVTQDFGVSKPTISRHLKLLEEAGVVSRAIDGRTHRLALRPEALAEASDWIERQRERWERLFDVVGEYLDERKERQ